MANVIARLIVGQRTIRIVACDRSEACNGQLHLHIETVENGVVTKIAQVYGADVEAIQRSGRLLRMAAVMVHGEEVEADTLIPQPDDDAGVLPGTRPLIA